jgi:hypothetical protein
MITNQKWQESDGTEKKRGKGMRVKQKMRGKLSSNAQGEESREAW